MPRTSANDRRRNIERVLMLIKRHPNGITASEIAQESGFERRTVDNYLKLLEENAEVYKDSKYWFPTRKTPLRLRPLDVEPEEAMALYLASRLLVKQSHHRNESIEIALEKLAHIISGDTGIGDDLYRAAQELRLRPLQDDYQDVFLAVIRSYLYRRTIEITYTPYNGKPFTTNFAPYLLEPSAIGFSTYAIGKNTVTGELRTYKIGRIQKARLTREEYAIPSDFDGLTLLRTAWSIYYGDETTFITLRFRQDVARRIEETQWHPSQRLEQNGDHLLMHIEVADFTDLIPWIRGWGAACEVLGPDNLRDQMIGEARQLAHLYGISGNNDDPHQRFADIFGD